MTRKAIEIKGDLDLCLQEYQKLRKKLEWIIARTRSVVVDLDKSLSEFLADVEQQYLSAKATYDGEIAMINTKLSNKRATAISLVDELKEALEP